MRTRIDKYIGCFYLIEVVTNFLLHTDCKLDSLPRTECSNTIQYSTIQYSTTQYNTVQYNTIQYNTITFIDRHMEIHVVQIHN